MTDHDRNYNRTIAEHAVDNIWRLEQILHLGSMLGDEAPAAAADDAFDFDLEHLLKPRGLPQQALEENWELADIAGWLRCHDKYG